MKLDEFQIFIDRLSQAFVTGEYALWRDAVRLPLSRVTHSGIITCETLQELEDDFEIYHAKFQELGVTKVVRRALTIDSTAPDQSMATYDTELYSGSELVTKPYNSSMLLERGTDGTWFCTSVMNALAVEIKPANEVSATLNQSDEDAKQLYQDHLDTVGKAMFANDTTNLVQHSTYPTTIANLDMETTINTPDALVAILFGFADNMRKRGLTDYIRICKAARFVSPTQIKGWHVTHLLANGSYIASPYKCEAILDLEDGIWRMSYGFSHVLNHVNGLLTPTLISPQDLR